MGMKNVAIPIVGYCIRYGREKYSFSESLIGVFVK
jgi:hypothetical protein